MRIVSDDDAKELEGPGVRLSLQLKSRVTAAYGERKKTGQDASDIFSE